MTPLSKKQLVADKLGSLRFGAVDGMVRMAIHDHHLVDSRHTLLRHFE